MSSKKDLFLVGIGASAGGFESLSKFLKSLPENTGAAFVIIQHLSPNYESHSDKLFASFTNIPVVKVTENMPVKPDHIYVIPENRKLKVNEKELYLEERGSLKVPNLTIDVFFEALANVYEEKSVGIVLSGTGSDGARGVRAIKARGGMVMVQSPQSASFDSMPNMAISSDHPDYIAAPDTLAKELVDYLTNPGILDKEKLKIEKFTETGDPLGNIIELISSYSGVNFKTYKPGTVIRRIEKRMKINHQERLDEYLAFLQQHPKEVRHIFDDLLIGVTRFFRDAEAYRSLAENAIPNLCLNRNSFEPIRIWVTSCSTGEEAYSLAILFEEFLTANNLNVEFKIFATDVNQRAIDIASEGKYSNAIVEDLSIERINRFFSHSGDFFQIKKEIRRKIIFSKHNLLSDPPFIRLGLISCRNLFIYLDDETQAKLLHNFNYALNEGGYFFLGLNESNNEQDNLFETVDSKNKIFKNKGNENSRSFRPINVNPDISYVQQVLPSFRQRLSAPASDNHYADFIAEHFAPPSLLVNPTEDVVYTAGNLEKYLRFPNSRSDLNIYSMLQGNLLLVFRNGLRQIREGKPRIKFADVLIEKNSEKCAVDIIFTKIDKQQLGRNAFFTLVEFHDKGTVEKENEPEEIITRDKYSRSEIENLEMELKLARRELHFTADELETINEELQSSNEEMQSANEELQSTNEELQSSNEELHTVNMELKSNVDALTILHDDMLNLFNSTQIATIFLDSEMNIRKFTPPAKQYFNIRESDIGRPINHYSYNFTYNDLVDSIHKVLENFQPIEQEVEQKDGKFSIMRILPYKTESRHIKGVVITFTEITELKQKNNKLKKITEELEAIEQHLKPLLDNTPDLIARFDNNFNYVFINKALENESKKAGALGREKAEGLHVLDNSGNMYQIMEEVLQKRKEKDYYFSHQSSGVEKSYYTRFIPEFSADTDGIESILSISTDITELKKAERRILSSNEQLSEMFDRMDNFVHAVAHDLRGPIINLKLLSQIISTLADPKQQQKFISEIGKSISKLDNTLNGLIQIIEIENEYELKISKISFKDKLLESENELADKIEKEHAKIETDFSAVPSINYVEAYLESILKNMLSNALKYRSPDRTPVIKLKTEKQDGFIVLKISDNGRGINMEEHGHDLFKPFKRFHIETEGMGVGLYVIKYMVAKNGGFIEVESKVKEGTTFSIFLKQYEEEVKEIVVNKIE